MEGGGRSLVAKKGLDTHGGETCYDQMVFLVCPASQGVSKKFILERLGVAVTLRKPRFLQFDPKVKQCCSKLINPFERHFLHFENSSTTCFVVADRRWWSCYGSGRQVLHIKYSFSSLFYL